MEVNRVILWDYTNNYCFLCDSFMTSKWILRFVSNKLNIANVILNSMWSSIHGCIWLSLNEKEIQEVWFQHWVPLFIESQSFGTCICCHTFTFCAFRFRISYVRTFYLPALNILYYYLKTNVDRNMKLNNWQILNCMSSMFSRKYFKIRNDRKINRMD